MAEFVTLDVSDGIGTIRLDRPPMNALNRQVQEEIRAAAREATVNSDVRAVIVYGGEKVFAAGADIKEMAAMSVIEMTDIAAELQSALGSLSTIPKPVVAAVTGYALGGGLEVALGADRRIAGDNAKLGVPEVLLGVIPGGGGTQRLARLIGPSRAKDMVFTGRFVGAEEALRIGLVDEVVAPDEVYNAARAWAGQFTTGASRALAAAKASIDQGLDVDLTNGLRVEAQQFAALFATEDRTVGMESFIANGPGKAAFTGR
ncbi:enoyl-CoA hydratase/isomerase family protein [Rhodococcus fascians]|jgi:enoyl-CoA hydratase/carnithine racemase|uniref:enoyl-CoA hydratase/isomerase family protein n=1 Tax=unclassified Rhodococcus (in: high G+C Gram-positive bacteria) TaxID=192944 RepID=UPI000B9BA3D8|nr:MULTISPECIES: enoyl-CoA hydratase-related protein [unclassified Rhodococcus (in: high G+C Gram-positive bacteria)]MBY4012184.1 enoyl-CoA hydratase/isomerase family protein [Rhodococcus fascians]MBY4023196.1 enoyl-CoA hydratase/isomerase family protein [Rhodococcus fascians]OZE30636.1 enoyl-CoA hydratase [Rhodococcus sp. 05-2254-5]OZE55357.1 enoyl-CoA hydratase [Rhodococcus sp. 05-2254-1]